MLLILLLVGTTYAQIDGEFWWLNDKLAQIKGPIPNPTYEEVSEFENDETDKVVFNDDNANEARSNDKWNVRFQDHTKLTWPNEREAKATILPSTVSSASKIDTTTGDILDFKFPDDKFIWKDVTNTNRHTLPQPTPTNSSEANTNKNKTVLITDKVTFKVYKEETTQVQNICTYLKKAECKSRNGVVYIKRNRVPPKKTQSDSQFICCILPLPSEKPSKIYFANDFPVKRFRRSTKSGDMSTALKQRLALMRRRFPVPTRKVKTPTLPAPAKVTHKIVTPDEDYVDPYANIKNSNFKKSYVTSNPYPINTGTKYEYGNQDYVEDYVVELPRPGLVGLYSDHGPGSSWTYVSRGKTDSPYSTVDDNDDVDDEAPGYSTFDPRLVDRQSIGTDEVSYDSQIHTVNYHGHPDFHILQGFKLLNLVRNTSRVYTKNGRRTTTTERVADSSECVHTRPIMVHSEEDSEYDDVFDVNENVFKDCGKAVKDPLKECDHDKQTGEADVGSHPWLALAVLTKSPQSILCYASLVNPRAAVTAADCVYGRTSPGEVTLLAGIWDLEDDSSVRTQQRMVQIHIDNQYKAGNLAHNLAMLHWKRPLKLGVNVQPACVADPHVGDTCKFVGWGGYDQAIRQRPRWQRASILTPRQCNDRLSSSKHRVTLPVDTFCASIESRASVTGVGGPLTCNIGDRHSVVGVAVWRDTALVLLPVHDWVVQVIAALRIR
ncbi:uncharacterized protein LOC125235242 isoform X2 [Leguminivora glycinivorella]|uniref:uncharacterized protein LOC125235242 isoform X2 n=1 Tax=Leguminivora glycinivorella TaxID=1035111 RepID=UPI00200F125D|nr:uncharacterized protein LOC125235242 isoform X2 [Leguminivora glycinivorella]